MLDVITAELDVTSWHVDEERPTDHVVIRVVDLPVSEEVDCEHRETVCRDCLESWAIDYHMIDGPDWALAS